MSRDTDETACRQPRVSVSPRAPDDVSSRTRSCSPTAPNAINALAPCCASPVGYSGAIRIAGSRFGRSAYFPGMIFQPEFETLERHALEALQLERVQHARGTAAGRERRLSRAPARRRRRRGRSTTSRRSRSARRPTCATPIRWGCWQCRKSRLARIHASSGTTGNPTIGAYTKEDVRVFGEVVARSFAAGGIAPGDMFQVAWGYGLFTGGLGGHGGCETLGACAIPASSGNTARQIQLLCDLPVIGIGARRRTRWCSLNGCARRTAGRRR